MAYSDTFVNAGRIDNKNNFLYWYRNISTPVQPLTSDFKGACGQFSIPVFASSRPFGFVLNLTAGETTATFANLIMATVDEDLAIVVDDIVTLVEDTTPTSGYRIWGYDATLDAGSAANIAATKYFVIYDNVSGAIIWRSNEIKILTQNDAYSQNYIRMYYRSSKPRFGFAYDSIITAESNFFNTVYLKMHWLYDEYNSELGIYEEASTGNERITGTSLNRILVMRGGKWDRRFHEAAQVALGTSDEIYLNSTTARYTFDAATGYDANQNERSDLSFSNFNLFEYDYQLTDKTI